MAGSNGTAGHNYDGRIGIIIPANNEAAFIAACLTAVLAQDGRAGAVHIVVAANGCTDKTAGIAAGFQAAAHARGWRLTVLEIAQGSKPGALNKAEAALEPGPRIFLDADVICSPALIGQLRQVLAASEPVYATGTLQVTRAQSWITRAYASLWLRLPFIQGGAVGAGLFAVNGAGRQRWQGFPAIISDDTYVRLQFAPQERVEVPALYHWPMVEGWRALIRVRRRQDAGVREVYSLYPGLAANDRKPPIGPGGLLKLFASVPVGFLVYAFVHIALRLSPADKTWTRGR